MNNKKLFIAFLFGFLALGTITAAWAFSYNNTIQAVIVPEGGVLLVAQDMVNFNVNTSLGNVTNNQSISLFNRNGDKDLTVNFTVNKVLTDLSCPNYQNDCSVDFWNQTGKITSNLQSLWISPGFNNFTVVTSCIQFSCGQNISIEVDIQ